MSTSSTTPFPLGVFVGNADSSNAAAEATFEANYNQFQQLMGAPAQFNLDFTDQTLPISDWTNSANFAATSSAASPVTKGMTPVISLPMVSTAAGSPSADQTYKNFASGTYDSILTTMVKNWAQAGFSTQYWRPGWEMNVSGALSYAGNDAATQGDWVAAFKHIYTVLHAAGSADGVNLQVVWNPGIINASSVGNATQTVYPGSNYVDVIGADIYSNIYPYGSPNNIWDWSTNKIDTSLQAWASNPVNLTHYWTYPAGTQWALDSSQGTSLSLQNLIDFAKAQGKPIGIPEAGAGNTSDGANVPDDPTFPKWLASTLSSAGVPVDFVNIYDANGNGNYAFSSPSDGKPLEAAAWAQYFGGNSTTSASSSTASTTASSSTASTTASSSTGSSPTTTSTSGSDTLTVQVSEDAWQGDAQFTINVDGTQVGGAQTATGSHAASNWQNVTVTGSWGSGAHTVGISFINDAGSGAPGQDRNLYVNSVTYDGLTASGAPAALYGNSTANFSVPAAASTSATAAAGATAITLQLAEDAYNGDAQYSVAIDGTTVGQPGTVTTLNSSGNSQSFTLNQILSAGTHDLAISFLNDAYGGSSTQDRNLYVKGIKVDGSAIANGTAALYSNVTDHFQIIVPS